MPLIGADRNSKPNNAIGERRSEASGNGSGHVWETATIQSLGLRTSTFNGAYGTWAYFLAAVSAREPGLQEVVRVLMAGGPIMIVDNAGGDELRALSSKPISENGEGYVKRGFSRTVLDTAFRFDSTDEARKLLSFYFCEDVARGIHTAEIGFKMAAYGGESGAVG